MKTNPGVVGLRFLNFWAVIIGTFFVILLVAPLAISNAILQDQPPSPQPVTGGGDLQPVTIFLKENNKLSPRAPKDKENPQTASCPNGFVQTGLFGFGFAPIGIQEWRDVGDKAIKMLEKPPINSSEFQTTVMRTFLRFSCTDNSSRDFPVIKAI